MRVLLFATLFLLTARPGAAQSGATAGDCRDAAVHLTALQGALPAATWQAAVTWMQTKLDEEADAELRCTWLADLQDHLAAVAAEGPPADSSQAPAGTVVAPRPADGLPPAPGPGTDEAPETVYAVPFASSGNRLELAFDGRLPAGATVEVVRRPAWLRPESDLSVSKGASGAALVFGVDEAAPVGEPGLLVVAFHTPSGTVEHAVRLAVEAPEALVLARNYPNPFNPATTIGFQLPAPGHARLYVYDLLGREVARLVDGERAAGHHEVVWNADRFASGLYVYRLVVEGEAGPPAVRQGRMLLVK